MSKEQSIKSLLEYYMGKNTPDRQQHIIKNLRVEVDFVQEETPPLEIMDDQALRNEPVFAE
jgi:topoisomerase-4 subunit B